MLVVRYLYGSSVDARTAAMLAEAERQSGSEVIVTQGSWSDGSNSAGTHSGSGAADLRVWHLSEAGKSALDRWTRIVGFASWRRYESQGPWGEHIHAIAIGSPGLSAAALGQVVEYRNGQDGLAGYGEDYGPDVPIQTWEQYQDQGLPDTGEPEEEMQEADFQRINDMISDQLDSRGVGIDVRTGEREPMITTVQRAVLDIKVKNPITGKPWRLQNALWSSWFYSLPDRVRAKVADAEASIEREEPTE